MQFEAALQDSQNPTCRTRTKGRFAPAYLSVSILPAAEISATVLLWPVTLHCGRSNHKPPTAASADYVDRSIM